MKFHHIILYTFHLLQYVINILHLYLHKYCTMVILIHNLIQLLHRLQNKINTLNSSCNSLEHFHTFLLSKTLHFRLHIYHLFLYIINTHLLSLYMCCMLLKFFQCNPIRNFDILFDIFGISHLYHGWCLLHYNL